MARLVPRDAAPLCVAGVALGDIYLRFVRQAWHLLTSAVVLCGRRATHGTGLALVARLVPRDDAPLCEVGVALGDICYRFVWQAWRLVTSTFVLRGRRATYGTGLALVTRLAPRLGSVVQYLCCKFEPVCQNMSVSEQLCNPVVSRFSGAVSLLQV